MVSVHTKPEGFKNVKIIGYFGFVFKETSGIEITYRDTIVFEKLPRFQNVFRPHENEHTGLSNASGLRSVFKKLPFHDGLVLDGKPNRRNKVTFSIFSCIWAVMPMSS